MYEDTPATSPDQLTINLGDAVFCFEHASVLLEQGISPLDAEVYGWLIGASDALLKAGLDFASGTLRYALLTETAAIERRDARARELIASEKVAMMRGEVAAMLEALAGFFDREAQGVAR
jgi:hypothetical protein